jgi:uncharacterized membrane protein HdeD (DUF308 family)
MLFHPVAAGMTAALSTQSLVNYLQGLFGPLFLGIVGIVAIFFLFTREITRFVQFVVLAIAIAVIFYTPGIIRARSGSTDLAAAEGAPARGPAHVHKYLAYREAAVQTV